MENMKYNEPRNIEYLRLKSLIEDYFHPNSRNSGFAETLLSNMIIDGEDLVYILKNIESENKKEIKEIEDNNEKYENLVNNLESLIQGKEGKFIENIKNILKEVKQGEKKKSFLHVI